MVLLIVSETMEAAEASPFRHKDGSSAEWAKAPLDPFLGLSLQQGQWRAGRGVGVTYPDRSCPITTSNITSFNLYNASIDPLVVIKL